MKEKFYAVVFVQKDQEPTIALTSDLQAAVFLKRVVAVKQSYKIEERVGIKTKVVKVIITDECEIK